jgi:hypothetical protein
MKTQSQIIPLAVAANGTTSATFNFPDWAVFAELFFPAMDNGAIGLESSIDGTNYFPKLDPADGEDLVLCASGSDPGSVDISDAIRAFAPHIDIRITCASQTSGAVTVYISFRG